MSDEPARWREARRQQALVAAFDAAPDQGGDEAARALVELGLREPGARAARGLEAYRANAEALAERALGASFATVRTMVGDDDFRHLAREFWKADPPLQGDLGEWGGAFPGWLAAHRAMAPWPYLGDCARLDLALHRSERAADASLDAASLSLLETADPDGLHMLPMPGLQLLCSAWPIATIHEAHHAHHTNDDAQERAFGAVRSALAEARAENVLVARHGWRAVVHRLDPIEAAWTSSLLDGASLGAALERAGPGFDFAAWLGRAVRGSWLKGVAVCGD
jgi:hypothetical protein